MLPLLQILHSNGDQSLGGCQQQAPTYRGWSREGPEEAVGRSSLHLFFFFFNFPPFEVGPSCSDVQGVRFVFSLSNES